MLDAIFIIVLCFVFVLHSRVDGEETPKDIGVLLINGIHGITAPLVLMSCLNTTTLGCILVGVISIIIMGLLLYIVVDETCPGVFKYRKTYLRYRWKLFCLFKEAINEIKPPIGLDEDKSKEDK